MYSGKHILSIDARDPFRWVSANAWHFQRHCRLSSITQSLCYTTTPKPISTPFSLQNNNLRPGQRRRHWRSICDEANLYAELTVCRAFMLASPTTNSRHWQAWLAIVSSTSLGQYCQITLLPRATSKWLFISCEGNETSKAQGPKRMLSCVWIYVWVYVCMCAWEQFQQVFAVNWQQCWQAAREGKQKFIASMKRYGCRSVFLHFQQNRNAWAKRHAWQPHYLWQVWQYLFWRIFSLPYVSPLFFVCVSVNFCL